MPNQYHTRHADLHGPDLTYTLAYNLSGWPVVVERCGTSPKGLPIGVQIVAHPWRVNIFSAVIHYLETDHGGWQRPAL